MEDSANVDRLLEQDQAAEQRIHDETATLLSVQQGFYNAAHRLGILDSDDAEEILNSMAVIGLALGSIENPDERAEFSQLQMARFVALGVSDAFIKVFCDQTGLVPIDPNNPLVDLARQKIEQEKAG